MRRKVDKVSRFCVICGDKAKGLNFNALTCQSCKAFFRRNALSNKQLKCSFENCCNIDKITRKFCSCCRLKKCFDKGMKKEWILTEEEKRSIREKIIQNRLKRQKLQMLHFQTEGTIIPNNYSVVLQGSSNVLLEHSKNQSTIENSINITSQDNLNLNEPNFDSYNVQRLALSEKQSNSNSRLFNTTNNSHTFFSNVNEMNFVEFNNRPLEESLKLNLPVNNNDNNHDPNTSYNFVSNDRTRISSPFWETFEYSNGVEKCFASENFSNSNFSIRPNPILNINDKIDSNENTENYLRNYLNNYNNNPYGFDSWTSIYNIDPMMEFSSKLDNSIFSSFDSSFFSVKEKCLLKELCSACTMLHNPYKRMLIIKHPNYMEDHNCTIVDSFFHRLIWMSKRLSPFNSLQLDDQVQLLKFGLIEMLSIRSVTIFNPDLQAWTFMDDNCKLSIMIYMDAIQPCCLKYDYKSSVRYYYSNFKHEWKTDYIIFDLLTAIVLFTERPDIQERDKIREEKFRYIELLKHYLEMKYPLSVDAHSSFERLLLSVKAMQLLHDDLLHVFANTTGSTTYSPLLVQLLTEHQTDAQQKENDIINYLSTESQNNPVEQRSLSYTKSGNNSDPQRSSFLMDDFFCFS